MGDSLRHSQAQFVPTTPYPLPPQGLCCPVAGWCPQGLSFLSFFPVLPTGSVLLKSMKPATADTFKNAYSAGWLRDYEQRAAPELPSVCMRVVEVR